MNSRTCQELLQDKIEHAINAFRDRVLEKSERILSCMYSCLKNRFVKWAAIAYKTYPSEVLSEVSTDSFTDSILRFREFAEAGRLYHGDATTQTVVLAFYKNVLRENLQKHRRMAVKQMLVNLPDADDSTGNDDYEQKEILHESLEKALLQMKDEDRQIILWRHFEEKSNEQIAMLLNITVPSATNRIYRCMERLKSLIHTTHN